MPLVVKFHDEKDDPGIKVWRYWCNCLCPTHVLELTEHGEEMELTMYVLPANNTWKHRLKMIWEILRGRDSIVTEIFLDKDSRKELSKVIGGCPCLETLSETCCHQHPS